MCYGWCCFIYIYLVIITGYVCDELGKKKFTNLEGGGAFNNNSPLVLKKEKEKKKNKAQKA